MIRLLTIIERLISEPVSQRVNTESRLLHEKNAKDSTVDESYSKIRSQHCSFRSTI